MKTKVCVLLLLALSLQIRAQMGSNESFWIIAQDDFNERLEKHKDVVLRRYVVVPDIDKKFKQFSTDLNDSQWLAKFSFVLKKNKVPWIEKYMENLNPESEIYPLIKALYFFSKKQYQSALTSLQKLNSKDYEALKLLLIADCRYELLADKRDYKPVLEAYQQAIDKSPDEQNKLIINNRIKFIKYH
jgi:tetratricopeptide (TPR) repeat protein